ncbi:hypothetical protein [Acinetobacter baumannii]|uniref:hypothetical protein n=1 Tax=Acinetobacter baumannii TaxID=470 RepID=UPI0007BCB0AC|nr:hypothetical protein [Acinetobacter baumannii]ANC38862.1 hypothetical protein Aba3207_19775 [Acinetobacter baumannii]AXW92665.1 hypothetical protein Aba7847_19780 [Acinetobacter baumannii]AXX50843.1 hypothetical protein Aba10042_20020 [Acinetobacter baumannii]EKU0802305.1 hypothetical protein [Acinetobacter baumannii]EKU4277233.1 hypothetical protein [Acinetobacter baumannii]
MNRFFLLPLCCGSATLAVAKEQKNETKQQSMNEPNPITRYVNVLQKGEGRESKFVLCDPENKSCVQQERSEKHLAVAK